MAGGDASGASAEAGARERIGADGEGGGVGESEGGASLPEAEAAVRVCQGALPWAGEEYGTPGIAVRLRQPADGGGSTGGVVRPGTGQYDPYGPRRSPTVPPGAKGKCPIAGRQLPGCGSHNPRRPENTIQAKPSLVQSIPNKQTAPTRIISQDRFSPSHTAMDQGVRGTPLNCECSGVEKGPVLTLVRRKW